MEMKDAGTQVSLAQQWHSALLCPALNLHPSLYPVCSAMSVSHLYSLKCKFGSLYVNLCTCMAFFDPNNTLFIS